MKLRNLKKLILYSGIIIIFIYLILGLIEASSKLFASLILLPLLFWPYLVKEYEADASLASYALGCIMIIWFVIDFFILRYERIWWHIPVFIIITPVPAFLLAYGLWYYSGEKKIKPVLYFAILRKIKEIKRKLSKWNAITVKKSRHG